MKIDIEAVRARGIARASAATLLEPAGLAQLAADPDALAAVDAYMQRFAAPTLDAEGRLLCVGCELPVLGGVAGYLLGGADDKTTFEWGIAHGEARCTKCGWPARCLHYDVGPMRRFDAALMYHPNEVAQTADHCADTDEVAP